MTDNVILLLASDHRSTQHLAARLRNDGYRTVRTENPQHALDVLATLRPLALVIADMPDLPGTLAFVRHLRTGDDLPLGVDPDIPIVVHSDASGTLAAIKTLEAGADGFQSVGDDPAVLRALLLRVLGRALAAREAQRLRVGVLVVDLAARAAHYAGRRVEVHGVDFDLLARLAVDPTSTISKERLLAEVWDWRCLARTRTIDRHASRLRDALAAAGAQGFVVERDGGYRLVPFDVVS